MNNMLKIRCDNGSIYLIRKDKILSLHLIREYDPQKYYFKNLNRTIFESVYCPGKFYAEIRCIDSDLVIMLTVSVDEFARLSNINFHNPLNKKKRIKRRRFGGR